MILVQLLYVSKKQPQTMLTELMKIQKSSAINNLNYGITGVMAYSSGSIIQLLEGPIKEINHLYRKIVFDHRHHTVTLLDYSVITERNFPDWGMEYFAYKTDAKNHTLPEGGEASPFFPFPMESESAIQTLVKLKNSRIEMY